MSRFVMKTSDDGLDIIKKHEGLRLKAYKPTKKDRWTVGWGTTAGVVEGDEITLEEAEAFLRRDIRWAEQAVNSYVKYPLNQSQFDALVSFVYNVGATAFKNSTLLRLLNQGNCELAAAQFLRWDKQAGERLAGLTARRKAEKELFLA